MTTATATRLVTADDLLNRPGEFGRCELIRGEVIELPPPKPMHGFVAAKFSRYVDEFADEHDLGITYAAETGFLLEQNPDTVRAPDTAFVTHARALEQDDEGYFVGAPDLVVEVVSPTDTRRAVEDKVDMWLDHGTRLVWVAYPTHRQIIVYDAADRDHPKLLNADYTLDGSSVLPGFRRRVSDFFPR